MSMTAVPPSYMALVRRFPLRPIRGEKDYEAASAMLDRLAVRDEQTLDAGERDYLETLELLIEAYDGKRFMTRTAAATSRTPLEWLKALMAAAGTTPGDLQRVLGMSQPQVSLILSGKRGISKANIAKLAAHYHVDPSMFIAAAPATAASRRRKGTRVRARGRAA